MAVLGSLDKQRVGLVEILSPAIRPNAVGVTVGQEVLGLVVASVREALQHPDRILDLILPLLVRLFDVVLGRVRRWRRGGSSDGVQHQDSELELHFGVVGLFRVLSVHLQCLLGGQELRRVTWPQMGMVEQGGSDWRWRGRTACRLPSEGVLWVVGGRTLLLLRYPSILLLLLLLDLVVTLRSLVGGWRRGWGRRIDLIPRWRTVESIVIIVANVVVVVGRIVVCFARVDLRVLSAPACPGIAG